MANLMIRIVTLATCSIALIAAFSVTPAVAAPGTEPGGSEADYSGMGNAPLIHLRHTRSGRATRPLTSPRPKKPSSPCSTTPPLLMGTAQLISRSTTALTMPLRLSS